MRSIPLYSRMAAAATAGILIAPTAACSSTDNFGGGEKKIVFEVTGPPEADITWGVGVDQTQNNGARLPWKHEATSTQDPLIVVVTAQSKSTTGDIICKISIDGKEVKTNRSTGEFAVVICSNS